jgi:hypothetical protein
LQQPQQPQQQQSHQSQQQQQQQQHHPLGKPCDTLELKNFPITFTIKDVDTLLTGTLPMGTLPKINFYTLKLRIWDKAIRGFKNTCVFSGTVYLKYRNVKEAGIALLAVRTLKINGNLINVTYKTPRTLTSKQVQYNAHVQSQERSKRLREEERLQEETRLREETQLREETRLREEALLKESEWLKTLEPWKSEWLKTQEPWESGWLETWKLAHQDTKSLSPENKRCLDALDTLENIFNETHHTPT